MKKVQHFFQCTSFFEKKYKFFIKSLFFKGLNDINYLLSTLENPLILGICTYKKVQNPKLKGTSKFDIVPI